MFDECMNCGKPLEYGDKDTYPYCHKCDKDSNQVTDELYVLYDKQLAGEWEDN